MEGEHRGFLGGLFPDGLVLLTWEIRALQEPGPGLEVGRDVWI